MGLFGRPQGGCFEFSLAGQVGQFRYECSITGLTRQCLQCIELNNCGFKKCDAFKQMRI